MKYSSSVVSIRFLGGFELTINGKSLSDAIRKNKKLKLLFENIILNRHSPLSQEELILRLWGEEESGNPTNALKNLVYRLRNVFAELNEESARDFIIMRSGTYCWNNNITCLLDIDHYEELITTMEQCQEEDNRLHLGLEALSLYKGDVLPEDHSYDWAKVLASTFRAKHIQCFTEVMEILFKRRQFLSILEHCKNMISIDPLEEIPHRFMILVLLAEGNSAAALERFRDVVDLFYREKGEKPSEQFMELYYHINQASNLKETDLVGIIRELSSDDTLQGAYYCDIGTFKVIFRMMRRISARTQENLFMGMITVNVPADGEVPSNLLYSYAKEVQDTICNSLRKNDAVTKVSANQFVILLSAYTYENCVGVMERLEKRYKTQHPQRKVKLSSSILPVEVFVEDSLNS